jgi:hypothetical protein
VIRDIFIHRHCTLPVCPHVGERDKANDGFNS